MTVIVNDSRAIARTLQLKSHLRTGWSKADRRPENASLRQLRNQPRCPAHDGLSDLIVDVPVKIVLDRGASDDNVVRPRDHVDQLGFFGLVEQPSVDAFERCNSHDLTLHRYYRSVVHQ